MSPETEKSKKRKNHKNDNDDDRSVGSVQILEPKTFPKAYGDKPTFRDYLQKLPAAQRNKVLHEIIESLEKDKDGSPKVELAQLLMARPVACLVMSKKSAYPTLAHNMFYFAASVRDRDENHMDYIIFIGDRSPMGDPTAFVVDEESAQNMGGMKTVKGLATEDEATKFILEPDNDGKLKSVRSADTVDHDTPVFMAINDDVAEYVSKHEPSLGDLHHWLNDANNNKVEDKEVDQINQWIDLAAQSTDGENVRKKSSVLAHNFDVLTSPSDELVERLAAHLDSRIGGAEKRLASNTELGEVLALMEKQRSDHREELKEAREEAKKKLEAKDKGMTDTAKVNMCAWSGVTSYEDCAQGLKEIEGRSPRDAIQMVQRRLELVAEKNNLRLSNDFVTEDRVKMLQKGHLGPAGASIPLPTHATKVFSHVFNTIYSAEDRDWYDKGVTAEHASAKNARMRRRSPFCQRRKAGRWQSHLRMTTTAWQTA